MTEREGVFTFMDCSTSHVTPHDLDLLCTSEVLLNYPYREGHWVYCAGDYFQEMMKEARASGFSEGIIKALEKANREGCWWLRLDADGIEFASLFNYENEWESASSDTRLTITISSNEYGNKEFKYDSDESTLIGLRSLLTNDKLLKDDVERTFTIRKTAPETSKKEDPIAA